MREIDAHFDAYEHLKHLPRDGEALHMLRKAASMVKPMMRKRGWKVGTLAEFLPDEPQLLGLNINRTERILIRLRYHHDSRQFLPLEQLTDTLLHELSHIVWGPHDDNFHRLWNELRDEHQSLIAKGYSGDGFLSQGHKLGGKRIPVDEVRRQARMAAEKRKATTNANAGGRRLGGHTAVKGVDMRKVIADAATRRTSITEGCASGSSEAGRLSNQQAETGFRTRAEDNDANDIAIAQALQDLMFDDEMQRLEELCAPSGGGGLAWDPVNGLQFDNEPPKNPPPSRVSPPRSRPSSATSQHRPLSRLVTQPPNPRAKPPVRAPARLISEAESAYRNRLNVHTLPAPSPLQRSSSSPIPSAAPPTSTLQHDAASPPPLTDPNLWACPICTLHNPLQHLSCAACGLEQPPQPIPPGQRFGSTTSRNGTGTGTDNTRTAHVLPRPPPRADMRGPGATPFEPAGGRLGWNCLNCGSFMEREWWTCSLCGAMKGDS